MDACPYCGEDLADPRARTCPRCEAALDADDAGEAGARRGGGAVELAELDDDELAADGFDAIAAKPRGGKAGAGGDDGGSGGKAAPKSAPCPHCGKPVKRNQHRCPTCGRAVRTLVEDEVWDEHERFRKKVRWTIAGVAAAVVVVGLGIAWLSVPSTSSGKRTVLKTGFRELAGTYGEGSSMSADRQAKLFEKSHQGRYLAVAGEAREVDTGGLFSDGQIVVVADAGGGRKATVRISLPSAEAKKAKPGQRVRVEARLEAFGDDPLFIMDDGIVVEAN